jgi:small subunit ribosomal protein S14
MAKISMINRELKRKKIAERYQKKRLALKALISDPSSSDDERWAGVSG